MLFMDEEALKADPGALGGSSLTDFRALYSSMKAEDTTDVQRHVQAGAGGMEIQRYCVPGGRQNTPYHCVLPR